MNDQNYLKLINPHFSVIQNADLLARDLGRYVRNNPGYLPKNQDGLKDILFSEKLTVKQFIALYNACLNDQELVLRFITNFTSYQKMYPVDKKQILFLYNLCFRIGLIYKISCHKNIIFLIGKIIDLIIEKTSDTVIMHVISLFNNIIVNLKDRIIVECIEEKWFNKISNIGLDKINKEDQNWHFDQKHIAINRNRYIHKIMYNSYIIIFDENDILFFELIFKVVTRYVIQELKKVKFFTFYDGGHFSLLSIQTLNQISSLLTLIYDKYYYLYNKERKKIVEKYIKQINIECRLEDYKILNMRPYPQQKDTCWLAAAYKIDCYWERVIPASDLGWMLLKGDKSKEMQELVNLVNRGAGLPHQQNELLKRLGFRNALNDREIEKLTLLTPKKLIELLKIYGPLWTAGHYSARRRQGGGHAVCVIGVVASWFVVVSDSNDAIYKERLIPFDEFILYMLPNSLWFHWKSLERFNDNRS